MTKLPHTRACFCCGLENPLGLALDLFTDQRVVVTRFRFRREFTGFRQVVHGGLVSTVLDEAMAWACGVRTGRFAYCAELNVRFQKPARPDEELTARAELIENRRGRLLLCRAELRGPTDELLAEATGKYLPIKDSITDSELVDWVDDPRPIFGRTPVV